ncbi:MAG: hypothetical protein HONDAALG_03519 [Gammaproteobacteria bacterium]|nr:hypothetical protein [Gammaproteobacteria bacterium]
MSASLFLPRWTEVLLALDRLEPHQRYFQRVLRESGAASSYIREVMKALRDQGFIEVKKSGGINRLVLTASGNQLLFHFLEARRLLKSRVPISG